MSSLNFELAVCRFSSSPLKSRQLLQNFSSAFLPFLGSGHLLLLSVPYLPANYFSTSGLPFLCGCMASVGGEFCQKPFGNPGKPDFPHSEGTEPVKDLQQISRAELYFTEPVLLLPSRSSFSRRPLIVFFMIMFTN